jgi:predicted ATPase
MITSVHLQNFKAHVDTTVPLGRMTVLVGPNGSGKTSVLQALHALSRLVNEQPSWVFDGEMQSGDIVSRKSPDGPLTVMAEGTWNGVESSASVRLIHRSVQVGSKIVEWPETFAWRHGAESGEQESPGRPFSSFAKSPLLTALGSAVLYRFDARQIAASAYSEETRPTVLEDGSNTAVVLAALKLDQDDVFNRIQAELRRIVPNVERIRIRRAKARRPSNPGRLLTPDHDIVMGHKIYLDFKGAPDVPAHAASEGTLITLALLTAIHSSNSPRIVLLDDIDQSLHPQAQVELVRELKRLLNELKDVQIVATTHSPYILDEIDPTDVQVFALRDDGSVAVKSLSDHPEAARMKGSLSSGQIWSLDPEKSWVAG